MILLSICRDIIIDKRRFYEGATATTNYRLRNVSSTQSCYFFRSYNSLSKVGMDIISIIANGFVLRETKIAVVAH